MCTSIWQGCNENGEFCTMEKVGWFRHISLVSVYILCAIITANPFYFDGSIVDAFSLNSTNPNSSDFNNNTIHVREKRADSFSSRLLWVHKRQFVFPTGTIFALTPEINVPAFRQKPFKGGLMSNLQISWIFYLELDKMGMTYDLHPFPFDRPPFFPFSSLIRPIEPKGGFPKQKETSSTPQPETNSQGSSAFDEYGTKNLGMGLNNIRVGGGDNLGVVVSHMMNEVDSLGMGGSGSNMNPGVNNMGAGGSTPGMGMGVKNVGAVNNNYGMGMNPQSIKLPSLTSYGNGNTDKYKGWSDTKTTYFPVLVKRVGTGSPPPDQSNARRLKRRPRSIMELPPEDKLPGGERASLLPRIENFMESLGFEGRGCMLRLICEIHEYPLRDGYGLIGEMISLFFSISESPYADSHMPEYLKAERSGKARNCEQYKKICSKSIFQWKVEKKKCGDQDEKDDAIPVSPFKSKKTTFNDL